MSFVLKKNHRENKKGDKTGFKRKQTDDTFSERSWKTQRGFKHAHGRGSQNNTYINKRKSWKEELMEFEIVKSAAKPRKYTVSIAIPVSILVETCVKDVLRTYVVGQIARAASIYSVDEVVIYDDKCWSDSDVSSREEIADFTEFMKVVLEYQECPQYLRRHLFQYHHHLRNAAVLNAVNAPHHLRANQWCQYREGVVLDKQTSTTSFVDIGLAAEVCVAEVLPTGQRVTLHLPPQAQEMKKPYGSVVARSEPREKEGYYWGYTVRLAGSLSEVISESPFPGGYDLLIGTSDKGEDVGTLTLAPYNHALIVFGGVAGLETAVEVDKGLEVCSPKELFQYYVNTCPHQQTRTVRTEEAVLISLSQLHPRLREYGRE